MTEKRVSAEQRKHSVLLLEVARAELAREKERREHAERVMRACGELLNALLKWKELSL